MLPNKEGQHVPQATFKTRKNDKWVEITSADLFDGKTV
ncbi:MAG: Glutaredoxin-family domain protein, partial [Polaromonas sp.]|nr:Glutaredoxin-family domain protein [Polaromonas sp.]